MGISLTVGRLTLDQVVGVRIPDPQPQADARRGENTRAGGRVSRPPALGLEWTPPAPAPSPLTWPRSCEHRASGKRRRIPCADIGGASRTSPAVLEVARRAAAVSNRPGRRRWDGCVHSTQRGITRTRGCFPDGSPPSRGRAAPAVKPTPTVRRAVRRSRSGLHNRQGSLHRTCPTPTGPHYATRQVKFIARNHAKTQSMI